MHSITLWIDLGCWRIMEARAALFLPQLILEFHFQGTLWPTLGLGLYCNIASGEAFTALCLCQDQFGSVICAELSNLRTLLTYRLWWFLTSPVRSSYVYLSELYPIIYFFVMFEAATLWEMGRVGGILLVVVCPYMGEKIIPNFIGLKLPSTRVWNWKQWQSQGPGSLFYDGLKCVSAFCRWSAPFPLCSSLPYCARTSLRLCLCLCVHVPMCTHFKSLHLS